METVRGDTKRYRLVKKSWMVVRDGGAPSPWKLDSPEAAVRLVVDLIRERDDDREHFWVVFLSAQNHFQGIHEVSTGILSASLVHPREVFGPEALQAAAEHGAYYRGDYRKVAAYDFLLGYVGSMLDLSAVAVLSVVCERN